MTKLGLLFGVLALAGFGVGGYYYNCSDCAEKSVVEAGAVGTDATLAAPLKIDESSCCPSETTPATTDGGIAPASNIVAAPAAAPEGMNTSCMAVESSCSSTVAAKSECCGSGGDCCKGKSGCDTAKAGCDSLKASSCEIKQSCETVKTCAPKDCSVESKDAN